MSTLDTFVLNYIQQCYEYDIPVEEKLTIDQKTMSLEVCFAVAIVVIIKSQYLQKSIAL
jgi:hypothetical protein